MIYEISKTDITNLDSDICPVERKFISMAVAGVKGETWYLPSRKTTKFTECYWCFYGKNRFLFAMQLTKRLLKLGVFCTISPINTFEIAVFAGQCGIPTPAFIGKRAMQLPF